MTAIDSSPRTNSMVELLIAEQDAELLELKRLLGEERLKSDRLQRARDQKHADLLAVWQLARTKSGLTDEHIAVSTNVPVPEELSWEEA